MKFEPTTAGRGQTSQVDDYLPRPIEQHEQFLKKGIEAQRIPESEHDAATKDVLESLGLLDEKI